MMANKPILFALIISLGLLISCGNNSTGTDSDPEESNETEDPVVTTGTLEVTVVINGDTPDEDGYELTVDGD